MLKNNFLIIKLKKFIIQFILILFTICLIVFSKTNLTAAKNGLLLWANSIIPSLFPFFVATELLSHTNIIRILGYLLNRFMKPIFNVRGEGSFAFIMGIISGYPIGAKIASKFRQDGTCSKEECERLLSFTNNSGPLFIIGSVGITMFGNSTIGILLLITHLFASITVGMIFKFWKYNSATYFENMSYYKHNKNFTFGFIKANKNKIHNRNTMVNETNNMELTFSNLGGIIGNSITSSISTILLIGGFVVLFSVIISILKTSGLLDTFGVLISPILNLLHIPEEFANSIVAGIFELTNGLSMITNIHIKKLSINIILSAYLLGLGGFSVLLQVWSTISKTDLSIKPYIIGKFLHANIAALYTYIALYFFPFLNLDI